MRKRRHVADARDGDSRQPLGFADGVCHRDSIGHGGGPVHIEVKSAPGTNAINFIMNYLRLWSRSSAVPLLLLFSLWAHLAGHSRL